MSWFKYTPGMSLTEFVEKLLNGERDFERVTLLDYDFRKDRVYLIDGEVLSTVNQYLQGQDLQRNPLILKRANFRGIKAPGLFIPYSNCYGIDIRWSNLSGANLSNCNFRKAKVNRGTNLTDAIVEGADFSGSRVLKCAQISKADEFNEWVEDQRWRGSNVDLLLLQNADNPRDEVKRERDAIASYWKSIAKF